jgi:hypothetical protein
MAKKQKATKYHVPSPMLQAKNNACKMQLSNENHNTCSLDFSGLFGHPTVSTNKITSTICVKSSSQFSRIRIPDMPIQGERLPH